MLEYTCAGAGWHKLLDPGIPVLKKWRLREEVEEKFHGVLALNLGLKWKMYIAEPSSSTC